MQNTFKLYFSVPIYLITSKLSLYTNLFSNTLPFFTIKGRAADLVDFFFGNKIHSMKSRFRTSGGRLQKNKIDMDI